jgi:hypothetical protein
MKNGHTAGNLNPVGFKTYQVCFPFQVSFTEGSKGEMVLLPATRHKPKV